MSMATCCPLLDFLYEHRGRRRASPATGEAPLRSRLRNVALTASLALPRSVQANPPAGRAPSRRATGGRRSVSGASLLPAPSRSCAAWSFFDQAPAVAYHESTHGFCVDAPRETGAPPGARPRHRSRLSSARAPVCLARSDTETRRGVAQPGRSIAAAEAVERGIEDRKSTRL